MYVRLHMPPLCMLMLGTVEPALYYKEVFPLHSGTSKIEDTLGPAVLSFVERLSSSRRLKCYRKVSRRVSFVGRFSLSWRAFYQSFHCNNQSNDLSPIFFFQERAIRAGKVTGEEERVRFLTPVL